MKKFAVGFFLGAILVIGIGAVSDESLHKMAVALDRIAHSMEVLSGQHSR
jgi:CHASE3 domain sensor protein